MCATFITDLIDIILQKDKDGDTIYDDE